ncbi:T9SS type A sorting domain-containing protein [Tenacibaculum agarivorans]|uniref:T9SS type A sorting domain-containing protein n=1 Tax=Tenacibaculum agarivorans TaxID=1908389 RepID=UPI00094B79C2|nr:T9SS type A sorting domain-containing protein [Tenacibaculum agarivorans]
MKNLILTLFILIPCFFSFSQKSAYTTDKFSTKKINNTNCQTEVDFEIILNHDGYWIGYINNTNPYFPIDASTMTWQITTPYSSYAPISVPSTSTSFNFALRFGFTWETCKLYIIKLSYIDNCSGKLISKEKRIHYHPQLDPRSLPSFNTLNNMNGINSFRSAGVKYVKAGSIVTIQNSTLKFEGENSGIIIEPRGRLVLINSTIEGMCNSSIWNGIVVKGNPLMSVNLFDQGSLYIANGSVIKNAKKAIQVKDGGIVHAYNSNFINNEIALEATDRGDATINFTECHFETNDDILFDKMRCFTYLKNSKVEFLYGNNFVNKQTSLNDIRDYRTGIISFYSFLSVGHVPVTSNPNIFKNLYKGIDNYGSNSLPNSLEIKRSKFINVNKCISSSGSNGDIIAKNEFEITDTLGNGITNFAVGWGVHSNRCVNHIITENKFKGANFSYGIINSQIGSIPQNLLFTINNGATGNLYLNTFKNTYVAIQVQGPNMQTQISCNDFTKNNLFAINVEHYRHNNVNYIGRQADIGNCSKLAGNIFDYSIGLNCLSLNQYRHIKLNNTAPLNYIDVMHSISPCVDSNVIFPNLTTKCRIYPTPNKCKPLQALSNKPFVNQYSSRQNETDLETVLLNEENLPNNDIFKAYKGNYLLDLYVAPLSSEKEKPSTISNKKDNISVFPNPSSSGSFTISIKNQPINKNTQLEVIDLSGKILLHQKLMSNVHKLNISKLSKGIYFIRVFNEEKNIKISTIVYK